MAKKKDDHASQINTAYTSTVHVPGIDPDIYTVHVTIIRKGVGSLTPEVQAIARREFPTKKPRTLPATVEPEKPASKPARAKKPAAKAAPARPTAKRKAAKRG